MTESVVVIDYGSGNLQSVSRALGAAAKSAGMDMAITVSSCPDCVARAGRIVLPGVGAFGDCAGGIARQDGLRDAIEEVATGKARPFLGICVGMQLMAEYGNEDGRHAGFGWIEGEVSALSPDDENRGGGGGGTPPLRIPHMGWNALTLARPHPLWDGLGDGVAVYFLHGYGFADTEADCVAATCDYGGRRVAAIGRENKIGLQFHPEKSQGPGQRILANFLGWNPS